MSHAVFLYLPNIIGYIRVLLSIYSFYIYNTEPMTFVGLYFLSFALDAVDGKIINKKRACSKIIKSM
jgi:CDP-diacylglycerol--inositol 3-phosphatidyltransferase